MRIGLISVNDQPTKAMAPGGTEVFVTSLAKALQRRGHEVTVIKKKGLTLGPLKR